MEKVRLSVKAIPATPDAASASGMLGTARLVGQTTGAALVARMFNLFGGLRTHAALMTAGTFATLAAIVSGQRISRLSQP
ncbi:Putative transport protein [Dickeya dadantii 3937]|uniref:Putative transport protein n=1 Tax=Dickeya dadantii (strain 3937) TaxID=198628 RepID=E0SJ19_DICD3|nr:Putative transport protein [Dickeya dadantii 3937]